MTNVEWSTETPDIETSSADYARRFGGKAGRYFLEVQAATIAQALDGLPAGTVLDVGGGHGQLVDTLLSSGWAVTVHGSSPVCETNLREFHGKRDCDFLLGDLHRLPVPDQGFDVAVAVRLLPHVERWRELIGELCRVARKAVVLDYPSSAGLNALTPLLFGVKRRYEGNTRTYLTFSHRELRAEFARHGFTVRPAIRQFLLPMVVHRAADGAAMLRSAEALFRVAGLTKLAGSPVVLRADRNS